MTIKQWPSSEKPREKLVTQGAETLSNAELIAIFLGTGIPGKNAIVLAQELLHKHQGLRGFLNTSFEDMCLHKGIGMAKYVQLKAALEVGKRYLQASLVNSPLLTKTSAVTDFLKIKLMDRPYEVFAVLFLDNQHKLIQYQEMFKGNLNSIQVSVGQVIKEALKLNAAAFIIAHNHPSGVITPSNADINLTKKIQKAANLLDLRLLDHVIIADKIAVSLHQQGYLS